MSQILELFLETGVDSDCFILMGSWWYPSSGTSGERSDVEWYEESESEDHSAFEKTAQPHITGWSHTDVWTPADKWRRVAYGSRRFQTAYVVSLRDFIRQAKPANYEQLDRLLGKKNGTQAFSTTELSEIEAELASSKHPQFESPTVRPVDLSQLFAESEPERLVVYWIRWKNATIPGFLELRLY